MTDSAAAPPISVAQEALWFTSILHPQQISYNETVSFRKAGSFDAAAFRRAFDELVERHAAWRTTFGRVRGEAFQVVHPPPRHDLPILDLSALSPEAAEARAVRVMTDVSRVPYDLRQGPLVRPRLMRFPGDEHRLYLALHHLTFDGVSLYRVVLPELIALYDAMVAGRPSPLPEAGRYTDYARWEQGWIAGPRAARRLAYWSEHLAELPMLAFPHDHPRPSTPTFRGGVVSPSVPRETVERLRTIADDAGATLFGVLAATWAILLGRYSGQREVIFSTPASLRQRPEFDTVVGYCLTPVALRVELARAQPFTELVTAVRNEVLDALDHIVPFERVVRALDDLPAAAGNPIFQTMIVMEPTTAVADPEWSIHLMDGAIGNGVGATKLDLELQLDERPEGHLAGRLIYDRDLFEPATAERIAGHWERIVDAVSRNPSLTAADIPLLTAAEEQQQVVEWNATATLRETDASAVMNAALALATEVGITAADVILALPSATELDVTLATVTGARLVPAPPLVDGAGISRLVATEKVTLLHADPSVWRTLIGTGLRPGRSLRALSGGGRLPRVLADEILTRCGVLWNAHGADHYALLGRVEATGPVTIGRPIANARAVVLDDRGHPAPIGVAGELAVDDTATGDRARWLPDGRIELL